MTSTTHWSHRRRWVIFGILLTLLAGFGFARQPTQAASPSIVISQVYGGGGNAGAPYTNDFIELFNPTAAPVSINGWSVQYASAANNFSLVTALPNATIPAGGYFLIREASGGAAGFPLPAPDATGSINLSATNGKVALVNTTTTLTCGASASRCGANPAILDLVGFGSTASDWEGTGPTASPSNTTAVLRAAGGLTDTDNNAADFSVGAPTPRNSGGVVNTPTVTPTPVPLRIHDIQGASHLSPRAGQGVANVSGIVTARRTNGFYMQDPLPDADPATSEAIFVFTSSAPTVSVGDAVRVNGTVSEFRAGGSGSTNLTQTEITGPSITVDSTGNALPTPVVIGLGGRVPPATVIEDDATGSVETSGVFDPATDGIDFYESLESMRVQVNDPVAVGPTNAFGEIPVVGDDGANAAVRTTRGGIIIQPADFNPERIFLDNEILTTPAVNVGDHFSGPAVGIMDYSFGNFKLQITQALGGVPGGIAPEVAAPAGSHDLTVATFNLENLSPLDPPAKFARLAGLIVHNLGAPDLVAVEEIQDNTGPTDDGVVDASQTYNLLIAAIQAAGGPLYQFRQINPVNNQDGGQPGGNIRVGFLFNSDRGLTFVDRPGGCATCATTVVNHPSGLRLSASPGRIDPTNPAFVTSRKPLAGEFKFRGNKLIVIANHFNSKGGDQPLFGVFQPPVRSSEVQRHQQAQVVHDFVASALALDPDADIVVLGDLNDFSFSDALTTLKGSVLHDLIETLPLPERYTYVFEGNSQDLDHILLSNHLFDTAPFSYDVVHVNAEFADQASDHEPQLVQIDLTGHLP
jgi:predicted extracellular nuclease